MKIKTSLMLVLLNACWLTTTIGHTDTAKLATTPIGAPEAGAGSAPDVRVYKYYPLSNVRPGIMAYWIDPEHQPVPAEYREEVKPTSPVESELIRRREERFNGSPRRQNNRSVAEHSPNQTGVFKLPAGVERIVATRHGLLVLGTNKAAMQLGSLISYLDKPLQLVELTTRYIEVEIDAVNEFRAGFTATKVPFSPRQGDKPTDVSMIPVESVRTVQADLQALLDRFLNEGRARQLGLHQSLTPNNTAAAATLRTIASPDIANIPLPAAIETRITPTVNADGTITALVSCEVKTQSETGNTMQSTNTIVNIGDGHTMALGGLSTRAKHLFIFITPRIVTATART